MIRKYSDEVINAIIDLKSAGLTYKDIFPKIKDRFPDINIPNWQALNNAVYEFRRNGYADDKPKATQNTWRETKERDTWVIECSDSRIRNVGDAIKKAGVDMAIWEVDRVDVSGYDVTMKLKKDGEDKPFRSQNQRIKVVLKRKVSKPIEDAVKGLLLRLEKKSPIIPKIKREKKAKESPKALEICLMDPHYGLRCYKPGSDVDWSPDLCANMVLDTLDKIIELSKPYQPFEEIFMPLGNDFFHTDNVWNTTTAGTGQPEAESYLHSFIGGESLAIEIVERVKKLANVIIYAIPGNHDRTSSFMLGRIIKAYFINDKNVTVHADTCPFKFHRYGVNLIGYEHGHSIKPIRLAALMANECPEHWLATKHGYREWHLGDQHRKGVMNPINFEEQGVSVEFLPGLTAPNEWHRLKSFNWQKRGSMAFVWDKTAGPISRLQVNVDRYLNCLMGIKEK